jgi:hypothetical protein
MMMMMMMMMMTMMMTTTAAYEAINMMIHQLKVFLPCVEPGCSQGGLYHRPGCLRRRNERDGQCLSIDV